MLRALRFRNPQNHSYSARFSCGKTAAYSCFFEFQMQGLVRKQACAKSLRFLCLRYHGSLRAFALPRSSPNHSYSAHFSCGKMAAYSCLGAGQALRNLFTSKLAPDFRAFDPGIYIFPTNWSFNTAKHSRTHRCRNRTGSEGTLTLPTVVKPMFLAIALALRT